MLAIFPGRRISELFLPWKMFCEVSTSGQCPTKCEYSTQQGVCSGRSLPILSLAYPHLVWLINIYRSIARAAKMSPGQHSCWHALQCGPLPCPARSYMIARRALSRAPLVAVLRTTSCFDAVRSRCGCTIRKVGHDASIMHGKCGAHSQHNATWGFGRAAYLFPLSPPHRSLGLRADLSRADCAVRKYSSTCASTPRKGAKHFCSASSITVAEQRTDAQTQNGAAPKFARRTSVKDVKVCDRSENHKGLQYCICTSLHCGTCRFCQSRYPCCVPSGRT